MNVCYTCITGRYDKLNELLWKDDKHWKFICFTTEDVRSSTWEIIKLKSEADLIRQARKIKILFEFDCEHYLYVDGNIQIVGNLNRFVNKLKNYNISLMSHPFRDNLFDEVEAIIKRRKDDKSIVQSQILRYQLDDYPCDKLSATGIVLRQNNETVKMHAKLWWHEILTKSFRDQLSFDYCCWKTGIVPYHFPYDVINSETFNYQAHR